GGPGSDGPRPALAPGRPGPRAGLAGRLRQPAAGLEAPRRRRVNLRATGQNATNPKRKRGVPAPAELPPGSSYATARRRTPRGGSPGAFALSVGSASTSRPGPRRAHGTAGGQAPVAAPEPRSAGLSQAGAATGAWPPVAV